MRGIHFGDVFYVKRSGKEIGSETKAGRPAVIVSNEANNEKATTVNVVYLSNRRPSLPTHIQIEARGSLRESVAMCEQITTVSKLRIGDFIAKLSDAEMAQIRCAESIQLNMKRYKIVREVK